MGRKFMKNFDPGDQSKVQRVQMFILKEVTSFCKRNSFMWVLSHFSESKYVGCQKIIGNTNRLQLRGLKTRTDYMQHQKN